MTKNIWIVNPYGTLPSEGWRDYRSFMLACALASRGNNVSWWISDFEHRSKQRRSEQSFNDPLLPESVSVIPVRSRAYERNISLRRIAYERSFGIGFAKLAAKQARPDMVVLGDPSLFYSSQVVEFVDRVGCKLVVDILDLWPELFKVALPVRLRSFDRLLFSPLYWRRRRLLKRADGVVAVSKDFLLAAGVTSKTKACVSYLGVDLQQFEQVDESNESRAIGEFARDRLVLIYAGTLGDAYDIGCVLEAIKLCEMNNLPVGFVFAGDGPKRQVVEEFCKQHTATTRFLGVLPAGKLPAIYAQCDVGLCSYAPESTVSMPVKFYDYLAAGLYVFSSLNTEIAEHLHLRQCGASYRAGSPESLLELIDRALRDENLIRHGSQQAKILASGFDSVAQHEKMAEFVLSLCEE